MQRFTKLFVSFLVLAASSPAFAQQQYGYPIIKSTANPNCYMVTSGSFKLDLMRMCGQVTPVTQPGQGASAPNTTVESGASNSGGNCDYSYQLDSAGRRCGGRAADQRPGGK